MSFTPKFPPFISACNTASRKGINRTRRKLLLCFLSELLCLSFKLKLILKPAFLLKFPEFQLCIENKQLRLLIVLGLPHILTVIMFLTNVFTIKKADTSFSLLFCGKCVAANFSIFERLKIKRPLFKLFTSMLIAFEPIRKRTRNRCFYYPDYISGHFQTRSDIKENAKSVS